MSHVQPAIQGPHEPQKGYKWSPIICRSQCHMVSNKKMKVLKREEKGYLEINTKGNSTCQNLCYHKSRKKIVEISVSKN